MLLTRLQFGFYALGVGRGLATEGMRESRMYRLVGFYALGVGRGLATDADFWHL